MVYHELIYTTKEYMQCATSVDPLWLAEYGHVFYSIKEGYEARMLKRKREKAEAALAEEHVEKTKEQEEEKKKGDVEELERSAKRVKVAEIGARPVKKKRFGF